MKRKMASAQPSHLGQSGDRGGDVGGEARKTASQRCKLTHDLLSKGRFSRIGPSSL